MAVGRNRPCPCGSGRKFKRCCLGADNSQTELFGAEDEPQVLGEEDDLVASTAHSLAAMLAEERIAALNEQELDFLAAYQECLLYFLDGFLEAGQAAPGDEREHLADAYYYLLGIELGHLRMNLERGDEWAQKIRDEFEDCIITAIRAGEVSVEQVVAIGNAMIRERLKPGPEMAAVCGEAYQRQAAGLRQNLDPAALCAEIVAQSNEDPFAIRDTLFSTLQFAGGLAANLIGVLLRAPQPSMKDGAALGVLDRDPEVRSAAATALVQAADAITPSTLRRLIAIRRWLPEPERPHIDQAVRGARLAGVQCAQWMPCVRVAEIRAAAPDGAFAQMAMIVSDAESGHQLSALLFKRGSGIADAWTSEPQSMREIKEILDEQSGIYLLRVSRRYLDAMVGYYLNDGLKHAAPPPPRLLAAAELLQAPHWQPGGFGWRDILAELIAEVPEHQQTPASVQAIIAGSAKWGMRQQWATSWAEAGQEVEDLISRFGGRSLKILRETIIDRILEKRRDVWAERFTLTALWMKEAPRRAAMPWENFAIVAQKMTEGIALHKLPLMHRIAEVSAGLY